MVDPESEDRKVLVLKSFMHLYLNNVFLRLLLPNDNVRIAMYPSDSTGVNGLNNLAVDKDVDITLIRRIGILIYYQERSAADSPSGMPEGSCLYR